MDYNPFDGRYTALRDKVSADEGDLSKYRDQLDWYCRFDADKTFSAVNTARRELLSLRLESEELSRQLAQQQLRLDTLHQSSKAGLDPRYWFSAERSTRKRELGVAKSELEVLSQKRQNAQSRLQTTEADIARQERELERYRRFDVLYWEAGEKALDVGLRQLKTELEQLQTKKQEVDRQLREPLDDLKNRRQKQVDLQKEISKAEELEQRLSSARSGYVRAQIHKECNRAFGNSRPSQVIRDKQEELKAETRTIEKLEQRARTIGQRASREIRSLVIDGNNVCYQNKTFIGLKALQAMTHELVRRFKVLIVFDASIRRLLKVSDRDIVAQFEDAVDVHVVGQKQTADEMLLAVANDPYTYVISNDRFADFRDKSAVRQQRIFRHLIFDNKILIQDLALEATFHAMKH